jgi:DNA transformation protein and related proteins
VNDANFHDYLMSDVFKDIDGITSRRMFGGYGFYKDGIFFAILYTDQLHFKVGESNIKDFKKYNSRPLKYKKKDKEVTLSFWEVPPEILEDREAISKWIDKSVNETTKEKSKS